MARSFGLCPLASFMGFQPLLVSFLNTYRGRKKEESRPSWLGRKGEHTCDGRDAPSKNNPRYHIKQHTMYVDAHARNDAGRNVRSDHGVQGSRMAPQCISECANEELGDLASFHQSVQHSARARHETHVHGAVARTCLSPVSDGATNGTQPQ